MALALAVLAGARLIRTIRTIGGPDSFQSMEARREQAPDQQDSRYSRDSRKDHPGDNPIPVQRSLVRRSLHATTVLEGPAQARSRLDSPERSSRRSPERCLISPEEALGRLAQIESQYGANSKAQRLPAARAREDDRDDRGEDDRIGRSIRAYKSQRQRWEEKSLRGSAGRWDQR